VSRPVQLNTFTEGLYLSRASFARAGVYSFVCETVTHAGHLMEIMLKQHLMLHGCKRYNLNLHMTLKQHLPNNSNIIK